MKRILGTLILTTALTAPGLAADLGARTYSKAPALTPVGNWSGFYVGGSLGYGEIRISRSCQLPRISMSPI